MTSMHSPYIAGVGCGVGDLQSDPVDVLSRVGHQLWSASQCSALLGRVHSPAGRGWARAGRCVSTLGNSALMVQLLVE